MDAVWHRDLRLIDALAVAIEDAAGEMDVVTGKADDAFDEDHVGLAGFDEDDDVVNFGIAIGDEGHPRSFGRVGDAIDEYVVADEEGLEHGAGRDDEILKDEAEDEDAEDENGADGSDHLRDGFFGGLGGGGGFCGRHAEDKCKGKQGPRDR